MKILRSIAYRVRRFQNTVATYRHWNHAFRNDPLFELAAAQKGLKPRATSPTRSLAERTQVAERIIQAYTLAVRDQKLQREVYKVSNEWVPIYEAPLKPLIAALQNRDAVALRDLLDNFFRSSISWGLCGMPGDMEAVYFSKEPSRFVVKKYLIDAVYRYRLLEQLLPKIQAADLYIEDFGNPYGIFVGSEFVRHGTDYQYYYAHRVQELLEPTARRKVVAELGGGIGGFAYFLNRLMPANLSYVNLDLPEILCISSYQLLNLFPEKSFLLYGEVDTINSHTINSHDISLLPCFAIENMQENSVDVSFNSYSLAEMGSETVTNYTQLLSQITQQAILHVNHVAKALVSADAFPFDHAKFELVRRDRALWNLGRDLNCDEYEFLLERRASSNPPGGDGA
jgi:hypothetical protein